MKILVDFNNLGFIAQQSGMKLSIGGTNTTGIYGFIRLLRNIAEQFAGEILVLDDGRSWRYSVYPEYKGNRKTNPVLIQAKEDWAKSKEVLKTLLPLMGITYVIADNMEADDLAAKLAKKLSVKEDVLLVSGDGDWQQLIDEKVRVYNPLHSVALSLNNLEEQTGYKTPQDIIELKSIAGDSGDNIKSIGGIGEKTAKYVIDEFGSYNDLLMSANIGYTSTHEFIAVKKLDFRIARMLLDADKYTNYLSNKLLVDLNHPDIPKAENLKYKMGKIDEEALQDKFAELGFVSLLKEFNAWIVPFKNRK